MLAKSQIASKLCYSALLLSMCESRSCSVSVSFGRRLAAFFFAIFHVRLQEG
jgi:hypothetical protein